MDQRAGLVRTSQHIKGRKRTFDEHQNAWVEGAEPELITNSIKKIKLEAQQKQRLRTRDSIDSSLVHGGGGGDVEGGVGDEVLKYEGRQLHTPKAGGLVIWDPKMGGHVGSRSRTRMPYVDNARDPILGGNAGGCKTKERAFINTFSNMGARVTME